MFVRANFVDIYLQGMRDRSMRSQWQETCLTGPLEYNMIPGDICTRLKRYLYSAKCSWIIIMLNTLYNNKDEN